jgi:NAD(P)H-dependent FMN reductase
MRFVLISGSGRDGSTNTAALRTAAQLAPNGIDAVLYEGLGQLPLFNPDDDVEGAPVDPQVAAMRAQLDDADAILICTPEYAGALPAALKNLLEWTIGVGGTYGKPTAWINVSGAAAPTGAADAHESLEKVLRYAGTDIVHDACARIPLSRSMVNASGLIEDEDARERIAAAVARLAEHVAARSAEDAA